jgi:two-component system cell cycle response regulator DivK
MHNIAIIEDAEDNRDLLYYMLRDDFKVSRHDNGEDALRHFIHSPPDLVILDIWLPGMDGIEVLQQIRQDSRLRHTAVLALTAHAMTGDREKYLAAGFDEYVSKPIVDIDEFVGLVRRILEPSGLARSDNL